MTSYSLKHLIHSPLNICNFDTFLLFGIFENHKSLKISQLVSWTAVDTAVLKSVVNVNDPFRRLTLYYFLITWLTCRDAHELFAAQMGESNTI